MFARLHFEKHGTRLPRKEAERRLTALLAWLETVCAARPQPAPAQTKEVDKEDP